MSILLASKEKRTNQGNINEIHQVQSRFSTETEAYLQEICERKRTENVTFEVLFRPVRRLSDDVESFYNNLSQKKLLSLTRGQLRQLADIDFRSLNVLALSGYRVSNLFINIEARIINHLEYELYWLKELLSLQSVQLVVEITERLSPEYVITAFNSIAKLHDRGIKIALDDFEFKGSDLREHWVNTSCVDYIKLILPFGFEQSEKIRLDFIEHIYELKNMAKVSVIIEKIETLEQFFAMEFVPYDGLQGYLFSKPEKLAKFLIK